MTQAAVIPASNSFANFFEGVWVQTANPSKCRLLWIVGGVDAATQTARMLWWANTTSGVAYNAVKYVRAFMLIFNNGLASTHMRYKYLSWGWQTTTNIVTTTVSANSNKTTYVIPIAPDKRCLVTFKEMIHNLNIDFSPYLTWTFDSTINSIRG